MYSYNPLNVNDIHIGLDMNLTGLTNYYTKQDSDNTLLNYYTKQDSDSKFENVSRIQAFKYPYYNATAYTYHTLGRLNLPNAGHHAVIIVNACREGGTNPEGLENASGHQINNYQMTAHTYSSTSNTSRAVFPGSLGNTGDPRYNNNNCSIYYNDFVISSLQFINPLGLYLALVAFDPQNQVDV